MLQQLLAIESRDDITTILGGLSTYEQRELLNTAIEQINYESEVAISNGNHKVALWRMSQEVYLEEEYSNLEYKFFRAGIYAV